MITIKPSTRANQNDVSFIPRTKDDILYMQKVLSQKVPAEIAAKVIEDAQYWEVNSYSCSGVVSGHPVDTSSRHTTCPRFIQNKSVLILCTDEIDGSLQTPLRRVIIQTISKDQGWSSYPTDRGTHNNSWTWFDIALVRSEDGVEKEIVRRKLWSNVHASREMAVHVGDLEYGDEIVNKAVRGDRLCIWASARFPGWRCEIEQVRVWVFTAVH